MLLITLGLVCAGIFLFIRYHYSYWKRKGFPYLQPNIMSGNLESFINKTESFSVSTANLYNKSKEPFIGVYLFFQPTLLIRDPDLVKTILTVDFQNFHDRNVYHNEKDDPISANLFNLEGKKWKDLRNNLTPTFTSGKLKGMFSSIELMGERMIEHIANEIKEERSIVEIKDIAIKYTTDVIVSIFFGLEVNSFESEDHAFAKVRDHFNKKGFLTNLAGATSVLCPKLFGVLKLYKLNNPVHKAMVDVVNQTIDYREKTNTQRKDFMQLLMQIRNTQEVEDSKNFLSINQIAAQSLLFLIAGLETTASTIGYVIHELTQNEDIMKKLKEDITETLKKHNGIISYDSIQEMKYLEMVIQETLRLYPSVPILNRICTKNYNIPNSNLIIEEGTAVTISLLGLQRDPQYFEDPDRFNPERFCEDNKIFNQNAYIPFGQGPRSCIGIRQGKVSAKAAIVWLLTNFELKKTKTQKIEFDNYSLILLPKGGIHVKATKITQAIYKLNCYY